MGAPVTYLGLHDLVRDCTKIQTLYPNVPKERVFVHTSDAVGEGGGSPAPPPASRFSGGGGQSWEAGGATDPWGEIDMLSGGPSPGLMVRDPDMMVAAPE